MKPDAQQTWVRASEVGQYTFCARAWWLQHVRGVRPDDEAPLASGRAVHQRHGLQVRGADVARWLALALILLALLALLLAITVGHG